MFIDRQSQFTSGQPSGAKPPVWRRRTVRIWGLTLAGTIILAVAVVGVLSWRSAQTPTVKSTPEQASSDGRLTRDAVVTPESVSAGQTQPAKSESFFFGDFYKQLNDALPTQSQGVKLPFNTKQDAANYYPFIREINLDQSVSSLDANGLAVIDNPFAKTAPDFYGIYAALHQRNIPFLVTADFLLYYYQNSIKSIYKSVEADAFYQVFWDLNKDLFTQADKRYRDLYAKTGILNDPALEGLRLEAVYFAMNLTLLTPRPNQVLPASQGSQALISTGSLTKFTTLEAEDYAFTAPDYLADTINGELALINKADRVGQPTTSPVFLYQRDYSLFKIPADYTGAERLKNFYLALRWTTSAFPLYYQDKNCPNCLLDQNDWLINQDRKSTRLNSSHSAKSRMPSSA